MIFPEALFLCVNLKVLMMHKASASSSSRSCRFSSRRRFLITISCGISVLSVSMIASWRSLSFFWSLWCLFVLMPSSMSQYSLIHHFHFQAKALALVFHFLAGYRLLAYTQGYDPWCRKEKSWNGCSFIELQHFLAPLSALTPESSCFSWFTKVLISWFISFSR